MNLSPALAPVFSETTFALTLGLLLLTPLAIAGLALINAGLGRSRSAAQALLGNVAIFGVAAIVFVLVGATFAGLPDGPSHLFHLAGKPWNWLGEGSYFFGGFSTAAAQSQLALLDFGLPPVAQQQPCSPLSSFLCSPTGFGRAAGLPNSA